MLLVGHIFLICTCAVSVLFAVVISIYFYLSLINSNLLNVTDHPSLQRYFGFCVFSITSQLHGTIGKCSCLHPFLWDFTRKEYIFAKKNSLTLHSSMPGSSCKFPVSCRLAMVLKASVNPLVVLPCECQKAAGVCSVVGHFSHPVCPIKLWVVSMPVNSHASDSRIGYHVLCISLMGGDEIA